MRRGRPDEPVPSYVRKARGSRDQDTDTFKLKPNYAQFGKWFTGTDDGSLDDVMVATAVLGSPHATKMGHKPSAKPIEGIVYREPLPAVLTVCQGTTCGAAENEIVTALQPINVPQLGRYMSAPLKNSWFDNNNLGISFAQNGVPCATTLPPPLK